MKPAYAREVLVILVHLAIWSQLGVLTRIYLDVFVANGCTGGWGVCLTSAGLTHRTLGAYFPDLVSNMLGSFIMGLLAASATLGLATKKAVAVLPTGSAWQRMPELHIGLRTGYCGSLTTFASWEYSLVTGLIGGQGKHGGQWAEFLWGFIIGLHTSLASYYFGEQCALLVDRWLVPSGAQDTSLEGMQAIERASMAAAEQGKLGGAAQGLDLDDFGNEVAWEQEQRTGEATVGRFIQKPADDTGAAPGQPLNGDGNNLDGLERGGDTTEQGSWLHRFLHQEPGGYALHNATNVASMLLLAAMLALFVCLAVLDHNKTRRGRWLAVLFGPAGCTLRWYLSRFNYSLQGRWKWLPFGTFMANMIACLVDYFMGGALQQVGKKRSSAYWAVVITYAIKTGFAGACSTVSTFVAEIKAQLNLLPEVLHGYYYAVGSLAVGALLGVVVYGPMVWTA